MIISGTYTNSNRIAINKSLNSFVILNCFSDLIISIIKIINNKIILVTKKGKKLKYKSYT